MDFNITSNPTTNQQIFHDLEKIKLTEIRFGDNQTIKTNLSHYVYVSATFEKLLPLMSGL